MTIWYKRLFWLISAFFLQRVLFWSFNLSLLHDISIYKLLGAFAEGFRFDICIIASINSPIAIFHSLRLLAFKLPFYYQRRFLEWIDHSVGFMFVMANVPLIVFGIVDSRLYAFTGRRTNPTTFAIGEDILNQAVSILSQYWYMTLPGLFVLFAFAHVNWQRDHSPTPVKMNRRNLLILIAILSTTILASRGGLQTKPLAPTHAYHWQPAALSNLVLNSGVTFLRSPPTKHITRYRDFSSLQDIAKVLGTTPGEVETLPIAEGKNIVVIVVESLASEYVGFLNHGKGYTPFLDQLSLESIYFYDSFANGRRSIDAIPAIFAGIPAWRDEPYITSPFVGNEIQPLPKTLKDYGYQNLFFHGASNGSMHFDSFASLAGFDEYLGKNEYPNKGDDDGHWGIFDEPFLQYASDKLSKTKQPFFAGIFTLTSHNPFKIPDALEQQFPQGTLAIHKSIGYADYSLRRFFESASKEPWFRNTIFVITGDHTSLSDNPEYNNLPGRFRVPIMFYDPTGRLPKVESSKVATHIDIAPTIYEMLGIKLKSMGFFGGPLFARAWTGRFFQQEYETWYFFDGKTQARLQGDSQFYFYPPNDLFWKNPVDSKEIPNSDQIMNQLKAARQYYINGLLDNNWYSAQ